jgi:IS30 family transposase
MEQKQPFVYPNMINDTAFARHARLREPYHVENWFCDAYASWKKQTVENSQRTTTPPSPTPT